MPSKKTATGTGMLLNKGLGSVHITPVEFKNGVLFLRPASLSVHTNPSRKWSFWKALFKPEEFENADFLFWCGQKTF